MSNLKISQLPEYTGNTTGVYLVMNNSGETATYKVKKETLSAGTSGTSGTSGSSGSSGTAGTSGSSGSSGTSGVNGSSGTSGTSGGTGSSGTSGTSGSSGISGTSGTSVSVSGTTNTITKFTSATTVGNATNLRDDGVTFRVSQDTTITGSFIVRGNASVSGSLNANIIRPFTSYALGGQIDLTGSNAVIITTPTTVLRNDGVGTGDLSLDNYNIGFGNNSYIGNTQIGQLAPNSSSLWLGRSAYSYSKTFSIGTNVNNTAIGYRNLENLRSGSSNTSLGSNALFELVTGSQNIAVGSSALNLLNKSDLNIAIGQGALQVLTTGSNNIHIGEGGSNSVINSGSYNTFIGSGNAYATSSVPMSNNVIIGSRITGLNANNLTNTIVLADGSGNIKLISDNNTTAITGSVNMSSKLNLKPQNPLPSGVVGDLAVSSSNALYFHNGTSWTLIS